MLTTLSLFLNYLSLTTNSPCRQYNIETKHLYIIPLKYLYFNYFHSSNNKLCHLKANDVIFWNSWLWQADADNISVSFLNILTFYLSFTPITVSHTSLHLTINYSTCRQVTSPYSAIVGCGRRMLITPTANTTATLPTKWSRVRRNLRSPPFNTASK